MGRKDHKRWNRPNKQTKKQQRAIKPDSITRFGPVKIAQFGQFTKSRVKWDPAEYAKMRASLPGRREELRKTISEQVDKAVGIITKMQSTVLDQCAVLEELHYRHGDVL